MIRHDPAQTRRPIRLLCAASVVHPFPTLLNGVVVAVLAEIATRGAVGGLALLRLVLIMLAIQSTIGSVNDLRDLPADRLTKSSKPLVRGDLSPASAAVIAVSCALTALWLAAGFGPVAWLLAVAGLTCGLLYDLWLKQTSASALPYLVALPLLPLWVWVALGRFSPGLLALLPLAVLLGVALHLANSLPDLELDEQAGVRGLAHRLGRRAAMGTCWSCYALALLGAVVSGALDTIRLGVLLPGLIVALGALLLSIALYRRAPGRRSLQAGWGLLAVGCAVLAAGWLGGFAAR